MRIFFKLTSASSLALRACLVTGLVLMAGAVRADGHLASEHGAMQADGAHKGLSVENVWARPSTGKTGAAYFAVTNHGASGDVLTGITGDVADKIELHDMTMDGNIMRMRKLDALAVAAGETVAAAPGGKHVMLIGLKAPLVEGETFPLTLVFEKAGDVPVIVHVQAKPIPVKPADMSGMKDMGH
tara:strand:- start:3117 stop:3671 length:555 start_codon:yes stop_codon:yes gene_type:complete